MRALYVIAAVVALFPGSVAACMPPYEKDPVEKRIREADVIVTAVAREKKDLLRAEREMAAWTTRFTVEQVHKGPEMSEFEVFSRIYTTCGAASFELGQRYTLLLSVHEETGELSADVFDSELSDVEFVEMQSLKINQPGLFGSIEYGQFAQNTTTVLTLLPQRVDIFLNSVIRSVRNETNYYAARIREAPYRALSTIQETPQKLENTIDSLLMRWNSFIRGY